MASMIDKTVTSKYQPKSTNVIWIDTSLNPPVEKHFVNGKWKSIGGGVSDYSDIKNKPTINGVELDGNKTSQDLGVYSKPSSGIPQSDLSSDVQSQLNKHFKGWYASSSNLPANPVVGDYAYVKGTTSTDPAAIYECTTAGSWSDSGRTADTSNVQTFASGEEVNETYIDDTHLDSPADGSLALAKDVKDFVFSDSAKTALVNILSKVAFIDGHGQDYISNLYLYLFPNVVSINAVFTQGGAVIYEVDDLATLKQYLVVTALYQDGTTVVLPSNAYTLSGTLEEGQSTITATYGDKSDTFTVTVTATPREVLFGAFTDGYAVQKGLSDNIQKSFRFAYSSRATTHDPCENRGYVFTVTDSSKYNISVNDVTSLQKQTNNVPSQSVDGYYYIGGNKSISWKTEDSVTTPYCWIALKKMDGTAFTAEELANGAAAVFNFTKTS